MLSGSDVRLLPEQSMISRLVNRVIFAGTSDIWFEPKFKLTNDVNNVNPSGSAVNLFIPILSLCSDVNGLTSGKLVNLFEVTSSVVRSGNVLIAVGSDVI